MIGLPEAVLAFGGSLIAMFVTLSLAWWARAQFKRNKSDARHRIAVVLTEMYNVSNEGARTRELSVNHPNAVMVNTETVQSDNSAKA